MPQNTHLEIVSDEAERLHESTDSTPESSAIQSAATSLAAGLAWMPGVRSSQTMLRRCMAVQAALKPLLRRFRAPIPPGTEVPDDFRWLHDNARLVDMEMHNLADAFKTWQEIPHVYEPGGAITPRPAAIAAAFLQATNYQFKDTLFSTYIAAFQQTTVLNMKELIAMAPALKLVLLEEIARRATNVLAVPEGTYSVGVTISSLREVTQASWKDMLEPLILFDRVLRNDPTGDYARMDFESRELYRKQVVEIARRCDLSEMEVAEAALELARDAQRLGDSDPRMSQRRSHVGYYLLAEGAGTLYQRVGFRPKFIQQFRAILRNHPDEFYLGGIAVLTFAIVSAIVLLLTFPHSSPYLVLLALLALLLPSSQSAVQIMNYLTTSLLRPQIIPKLDFSEGVPDDCPTLVVVPSLLLSEQQVCRLVDDLEVRFLGNRDRNVQYVLLSDLPDSRQASREDSPFVDLCSDLIRKLNEKYSGQGKFLLLHRHRVYNPREKVWMGWERKRGKLLDLNRLLRGGYDSFPVKVGDLSALSRIRFVITLDADTELPRGSAKRMIGALAHPLNQAIIDPVRQIVVAGYGILQPRVGVSVQSAVKSRLAAIYSGETGFDIYTRAISDVYQDLYGEAIFAGKGIYEVDTLHHVVDRRFPRNALLSHDLIEGAYTRVGLVSDLEIIEDYPSHYSAYNRRKHRWLRGDWQITAWLRPTVPDESGARVPNPISLVSQWKILDNLRRSLVEPAILVLLVLGWCVLPGRPVWWTLATLAILFLPAWCRLAFEIVRAIAEDERMILRDAVLALFAANVTVLLNLTFLAHQMLLSIDAVIRTLVRRLVTRQRLLQWETAAEAELGTGRIALDVYLDIAPVVAVALGVLVWYTRRPAIYSAYPILILWAASAALSAWLNRPPRSRRYKPSDKEQRFLRQTALRTWRYFAEYSNDEHHWLIPDNVQEEPPVVAARVSPTNLGFLLNTRQVACTFGYLTTAEFAEQTLKTLATFSVLEKFHGHLLNWYDTRTLAPLKPRFVSSVDSGNLVASLWSLEQGALDQLRHPVLQDSLALGLLDHFRTLADFKAFSGRRLGNLKRILNRNDWLLSLLTVPDSDLECKSKPRSKRQVDIAWYQSQAVERLQAIRQSVSFYTPWLLPEFDALRHDPTLGLDRSDNVTLEQLPGFIDKLSAKLQAVTGTNKEEIHDPLCEELLSLLPQAHSHASTLIADLRRIAKEASALANQMDFRFLLDRRRKLLSVGFDVDAQQLNAACYDLLASEARIATFVAIAQDEIPQETWFLLGRVHTIDHGRPVLLSWTGTMFEYLMPAIWMRSYPETLLHRTRTAAVRAHQAYTSARRIPWGISESAFSRRDPAGNYGYHAFGLPHLALREREIDALVISPYSTFLALHVDAQAAIRNIQNMTRKDWCGRYGFYEAADYTPEVKSWRRDHEIVRCWMAHHQGMSLVSIANLLFDGVMQRWFHGSPQVQATELLLHEKPVANIRPIRTGYGTAAA